jgi:hypothetical protein
MNSIKSLITETEKGCGKPVLDMTGEISIFCGDSLDEKTDKDGRTLFLIGRCQTCQTKLETLKQCQTIAEEKLKEELSILERVKDYHSYLNAQLGYLIISRGIKLVDFTLVNDRIKELKQQLNPAQPQAVEE